MHNKNRSIVYAFAAAFLFGSSTPLVKLLLDEIQPVLLAVFLYLGSGVGLSIYKSIGRIAARELERDAGLVKNDVPWLIGAIISGGIVVPIILLVNLKYTPAATASLLMNFEVVATGAGVGSPMKKLHSFR